MSSHEKHGGQAAGEVEPRVTTVHVVVPARNEQRLLPGCLDAIDLAVAHLAAHRPDVRARVTVVLDGCTDGSEAVVRRHPLAHALVVDLACVGAARAAGVARAARLARDDAQAGTSGEAVSTWVANTDADSVVPPHWLSTQVALAETGVALVIGAVGPEAADLPPAALSDWWRRHPADGSVESIHGANLGFTLSAYLAVGGFAPLAEHEDVVLVSALRDAGVRWCATPHTRVRTSGRQTGRTPGGFARYLRDLVAVSAVAPVPASMTAGS